ncbi:hypothetical protein ACWGJP_10480 [Microbacterium sp. NPDC055903]
MNLADGSSFVHVYERILLLLPFGRSELNWLEDDGRALPLAPMSPASINLDKSSESGGATMRSHDMAEHVFAGWEPVNVISDEDREVIQILTKLGARDLASREIVEAKLKSIEGDLVPTCGCGWRGFADTWMPASSREHLTGQQFISHQHNARMDAIQGKFGARVAASAFDYAADAWPGDPEVAQWLRAQAEYLRDAGYYVGEQWPDT